MAEIRRQFGGINSDLPAIKLASGTATDALNVVFEDGMLAKRPGFGELEDDVSDGSNTAILGMFLAEFDNGEVHLICKLADGTLRRRQLYPTDDEDFSTISTTWTHSSSDAGWAFMWSDRWHYFDREGGSRWHPDINGGTAYNAGLPKPSAGYAATAAGDGQKEGKYHCHVAYYNSVTREEGVVSEPSTGGAVETRVSSSNKGGISLANVQLPAGYECDQVKLYTTMGDTEVVEFGAVETEIFSYKAYLDAISDPSSIGGQDPAVHKADSILDRQQAFTNAGGEPPGSRWGTWTGGVAIYGGGDPGTKASLTINPTGATNNITLTAVCEGVWGNTMSANVATGADDAVSVGTNSENGPQITITVDTDGATTAAQVKSLVNDDATASKYVTAEDEGDGSGTIPNAAISEAYFTQGDDPGATRLLFSIPDFPTMVPQVVNYSASYSARGGAASPTDTTAFYPRPWVGEIQSGLPGKLNEICSAGGLVAVYSPASTWQLRSRADGRLYPVNVHRTFGCVGHQAATSAGGAIHAIGHRCWTVLTYRDFADIAENRFHTTLAEIPAAAQTVGRMAYYGWKNQVWAAVAKSGGSYARRILVLDLAAAKDGALTIFEPHADTWASGEGITAMCELAYAGADPTMLLATSKGRILQYPRTDSLASDASADTETTENHFAAYWDGIFATERAGRHQLAMKLELHTGDNCADNLAVGWAAKRSSGDDPDLTSHTIAADNSIERLTTTLNKVDGRLYRVKLSSSTSVTSAWTVYDIGFRVTHTED